MRFYFIAAVMMGGLLLFENGTLQGSDYFWKTSRFLASEKQELQIELPVPLEPLLKEDEGYTVYQAEGENIFVDLHSEPLYLPEDRARYTQAGPQKRVQKVIERYNVQNVEMTSLQFVERNK